MQREERGMKANPAATVMLAVGATLAGASLARAADGTWINASGGLWGTEGNWAAEIATGAGATASFNDLDISGTVTVSLDSPQTIGKLIFGDTVTSSAGNWVLGNNGTPANILTLAGDTPTITVNALGTNSYTRIDAVIDGTQGLFKDGSGLLILGNANTYSGGTTISAGTLRAANNSALGSGAVTIANGARLELAAVTVSNTINLNGGTAISRGASGVSTLSGTVNLLANTTISPTGSGNGDIIFSGTVNVGANTLNVSTVGSSHVRVTGTVSGTGTIAKQNDGGLYLMSDNSASFSGTVSLRRGELIVGHDKALGSGTFEFRTNNDTYSRIRSSDGSARTIANPVTISAEILNNAAARHLFGSADSGSLTFTGPITINGNRKFEVYVATEFAGNVGGTGGFTMQTGTGTLILSGDNSYSGATAINAGTLLVNGANSGAGAVTVNANGTLGGTGSIAADVTFAEGSTFLALPGGSLDIGGLVTIGQNVTIKVTEPLTLPSYTVLTFEPGSLSGSFVVDSSISDLGYQVVYSSDSVSLVVPEPSMLSLLGLGGLALLRRRRG